VAHVYGMMQDSCSSLVYCII